MEDLTGSKLSFYTKRVTNGKITSIFFLGVTIFLFSAVMVLAAKPVLVRGQDVSDSPRATSPGKLNRATDAAQNAQGKLRSCQAREAAVKNRSEQIVKFSDNMLTKFASISARVQNFYTEKVQPSGKTVANYNTLLADIETKKASASAAVVQASATALAFSCEEAPKEQLRTFHQDMKRVIAALKEYRRSIRNLIVAVHTALGEGEKSASGAARKLIPTTTVTPTATGSGGTP